MNHLESTAYQNAPTACSNASVRVYEAGVIWLKR